MRVPLPLFAFVFQAVLAKRFYEDCPTPRCNFCLPAAVHDAPGIGFDLTTSYGTAAVHPYNGTVLDIAQVPASPAYKALMKRLGNAPPPPPLGHLAKWQRWWNKKRGRPATADVGALASLLIALKNATEAALGHNIGGVQPIRIHRVAPIPPLHPGPYPRRPYRRAVPRRPAQLVAQRHGQGHHAQGPGPGLRAPAHRAAVLVGQGGGLCGTYTDHLRCEFETSDPDLPRGLALFVSLMRHALYASLDVVGAAFERWTNDGPRVLDFEGGLDSLEQWERGRGRGRFASDEEYWARVQGQIVGLVVRGNVKKQPVEVVLLGGENATNGYFLATLRDALAELGPGYVSVETPPSVDPAAVVNPTFAAVRGMAVFARRRQEVPGHCMELLPKCEKQREAERAGGREGRAEL